MVGTVCVKTLCLGGIIGLRWSLVVIAPGTKDSICLLGFCSSHDGRFSCGVGLCVVCGFMVSTFEQNVNRALLQWWQQFV